MTDSYEGRGCHNILKDSADHLFCADKGGFKLDTHNWLDYIPLQMHHCDLVEVRFKNTRKGFYKNVNGLKLKKGDIVAVESSPGHDIGIVSLTGQLAMRQLLKCNYSADSEEYKKIYRKAKQADVDKWKESMAREIPTMIKSRKIAFDLNLDMKIGDVEFQGDGTKAIFYYIADDRVDFRELIKILAEQIKVRIEMKQIGARQEAGRIGGMGSCGRELCCSTWITNFVSVTTNSARYQEISLNPQKLAGQCGKLKCCLNYELSAYIDAQQSFPDISVPLETEQGLYYHQKTDVFKRLMWYSARKDMPSEIICLSVDAVQDIINKNKNGEKVKKIESIAKTDIAPIIDYHQQHIFDENSLSGFEDKPAQKKHNRKNRNKKYRRQNK